MVNFWFYVITFSSNNPYEVLIPGSRLYFLVNFLPVVNLDEVLIPGNHLHFLVSSDEL